MFSRGIQRFGSCLGFRNSMMFGYGGPFGGLIPMIFMFVFTVLAVVVIIFVIRKIAKSNKSHENDSSLEELQIRFVKGEITEEEYMRKKNILKQFTANMQ